MQTATSPNALSAVSCVCRFAPHPLARELQDYLEWKERRLSKQGWIELSIMRWMPSAEADYERIHPNAVPSMLQQSWYADNGAAPLVELVVLGVADVRSA